MKDIMDTSSEDGNAHFAKFRCMLIDHPFVIMGLQQTCQAMYGDTFLKILGV